MYIYNISKLICNQIGHICEITVNIIIFIKAYRCVIVWPTNKPQAGTNSEVYKMEQSPSLKSQQFFN
jgi:hypothetical protein